MMYIHTIKSLREKKNYKFNITKLLRTFTFCAYTFGLFSSISSLCLIINSYIHSVSFWDKQSDMIVVITVFFIASLKLSTYSLFLSRLHHVFTNSALEISNCIFLLLKISFVSFGLAYMLIIYEYTSLCCIESTSADPYDYWQTLLIGHVIEVIIDVLLQLSLLVLFNKSLFKLMQYMRRSIDRGCEMVDLTDNADSKAEYFLNHKQKNVIYIVARASNLIMTSTIATAMHGMMFVIITIFFFQNEMALLIVRTFQPIYCMTETLCVFLNFQYNDRIYSILCCGCTKCCYWCCAKLNLWIQVE